MKCMAGLHLLNAFSSFSLSTTLLLDAHRFQGSDSACGGLPAFIAGESSLLLVFGILGFFMSQGAASYSLLSMLSWRMK